MHHSLQMFILPLMTGHLFWKATIMGGLYRGVPLYIEARCSVENEDEVGAGAAPTTSEW